MFPLYCSSPPCQKPVCGWLQVDRRKSHPEYFHGSRCVPEGNNQRWKSRDVRFVCVWRWDGRGGGTDLSRPPLETSGRKTGLFLNKAAVDLHQETGFLGQCAASQNKPDSEEQSSQHTGVYAVQQTKMLPELSKSGDFAPVLVPFWWEGRDLLQWSRENLSQLHTIQLGQMKKVVAKYPATKSSSYGAWTHHNQENILGENVFATIIPFRSKIIK